jgi:hypothetical protein
MRLLFVHRLVRCIPQVHGVVHDTVAFAYGILSVECNSATDNPMIFPSLRRIDSFAHPDVERADPSFERVGSIISGGNFHGEYPAKALDFLTIGIHEIASISERRIERLVNPQLSGLPAFLVNKGGLHSGFMIAHVSGEAGQPRYAMHCAVVLSLTPPMRMPCLLSLPVYRRELGVREQDSLPPGKRGLSELFSGPRGSLSPEWHSCPHGRWYSPRVRARCRR